MQQKIKFGAIGLDHRHVFGQAKHLIAAGAQFAGWWTEGEPQTLVGFRKRFPDVPRISNRQELLDDPSIALIIINGVPNERAALAIEAMRSGKDVIVDKPGCTTPSQLQALRDTVTETKRIWSVDFSERFEVPSMTVVQELVESGAIGRVVQIVGLGPHRINRQMRPDWFYERDKYGGVICDIATHQIDQFLTLTGSTRAKVDFARVANHANPDKPELEDFGEAVISSDHATAYFRVDWYTPDALPTWGDGRLFLLGTEGSIEVRKYCNVGVSARKDNIYLVNHEECRYINGEDAPLPYFNRILDDIRNRTETAGTQEHPFRVMELAIEAQQLANGK